MAELFFTLLKQRNMFSIISKSSWHKTSGQTKLSISLSVEIDCILVASSSCPLYCVLVVDEHIVATGDEDGTVKVSWL